MWGWTYPLALFFLPGWYALIPFLFFVGGYLLYVPRRLWWSGVLLLLVGGVSVFWPWSRGHAFVWRLPVMALSVLVGVWTLWQSHGSAGKEMRQSGKFFRLMLVSLIGWVILLGIKRGSLGYGREFYFSTSLLVTLLVACQWPMLRQSLNRFWLALFFFWTMSVMAGGLQIIAGYYPVGIEGNPNWLAAALLGSIWGATRFIQRSPMFHGNAQRFRRWVVGGMWGITLLILLFCECRAAWLILGLWFVVWLRCVGGRYGRWAQVILPFVLLIGGLYMVSRHFSEVKTAIRQDLRLPMWLSVINMVSASWFSGCSEFTVLN
ncbi:MAG: hypothetical protein D6820_10670, partial [Lentisphaerae bacterium]